MFINQVHKDMNVVLKFNWPGLEEKKDSKVVIFETCFPTRVTSAEAQNTGRQAGRLLRQLPPFFRSGNRGYDKWAIKDHKPSKWQTQGSSQDIRLQIPCFFPYSTLRVGFTDEENFNNRTWSFLKAAQENQEIHPLVKTAHSQPIAWGSQSAQRTPSRDSCPEIAHSPVVVWGSPRGP